MACAKPGQNATPGQTATLGWTRTLWHMDLTRFKRPWSDQPIRLQNLATLNPNVNCCVFTVGALYVVKKLFCFHFRHLWGQFQRVVHDIYTLPSSKGLRLAHQLWAAVHSTARLVIYTGAFYSSSQQRVGPSYQLSCYTKSLYNRWYHAHTTVLFLESNKNNNNYTCTYASTVMIIILHTWD